MEPGRGEGGEASVTSTGSSAHGPDHQWLCLVRGDSVLPVDWKWSVEPEALAPSYSRSLS